jgi:hypothetical protein
VKAIWIFSLALPAALAGCAHDFGERLDDLAISKENRRYADRAWDAVEPIYENVPYEDDFEEGFQDGYVAMAETGVDTPPLLPPQNYWTARYRTAEGHRRARAWFDGFAHGSLAAEGSIPDRLRAAGQRRDDAYFPVIRPDFGRLGAHVVRGFVNSVQEIQARQRFGALQSALAQVQNAEGRHEETTVGC